MSEPSLLDRTGLKIEIGDKVKVFHVTDEILFDGEVLEFRSDKSGRLVVVQSDPDERVTRPCRCEVQGVSDGS